MIDSAGRTASATATSTTGTPPAPEIPTASSRDYAIVHYKRADGDYTDWRLYAWGDIADGEGTTWPEGHDFIGRDAYGAFAYVKLKPGASNVGYLVIDKDGNKDVSADRSIDVTKTGEIWVEQGKEAVMTEWPDYPAQDTSKAVLHYHRADGNYDGWGLHVWTGAATPTDWSKPLEPVRTDAYGAVFEVPLTDGATNLSYIIHKGDDKDLSADQSLDLKAGGHEVWLLNGQKKYLLPQSAGSAAALDLTTSKAVWIDRNTLAWNGNETAASTQLLYSRTGSIKVNNGALTSTDERWLCLTKSALTDAQKAKFPHLKSYTAWTVDPRDRDRVREALRGQLVASQRAANGAVLAATGVQIAGVLGDLHVGAKDADLGPTFRDGRPTLAVWAPTAQQVSLDLDGTRVAMKRNGTTGVGTTRTATTVPEGSYVSDRDGTRRTVGFREMVKAAMSPTTPGSSRPRRTWPGRASRPSPTGRGTPYAAAGPSTPTRASRGSPPASIPTPTPRTATALRPSRRPGSSTTRTSSRSA